MWRWKSTSIIVVTPPKAAGAATPVTAHPKRGARSLRRSGDRNAARPQRRPRTETGRQTPDVARLPHGNDRRTLRPRHEDTRDRVAQCGCNPNAHQTRPTIIGRVACARPPVLQRPPGVLSGRTLSGQLIASATAESAAPLTFMSEGARRVIGLPPESLTTLSESTKIAAATVFGIVAT